MDQAERERLRREIVDEVAPILSGPLAGDAWGRVLVEVVRAPGGDPVVAGVDVEEIAGDEARVEAAFGGDEARGLMPVLAKATEALCALEAVELEDVGGGTFVRAEGGFAWLPGLVKTPSARFDRERDGVVARLREKNARLAAELAADRVELDVEAMTMRWIRGGHPSGQAHATVLGTFARAPRVWAWAWDNPSLPEPVRRAAASVADALEERDLWEISTPAFATDEATAWALAAWVCDRAGADGVQRLAQGDGAIFVLVRDARAV